MTKKRKNKTRRQIARDLKDHQIEQLITWIAIGVGAVVVLVLGYGLVTELFVKARRPVAQVNDVEIATQDFTARQRYERTLTQFELLQYQNYLTQMGTGDEETQSFTQQLQMQIDDLEQQLSAENAQTFSKDVLDQMVEEELVRQAAEERGLTVSPEEIDLQVEQMMGYDRQAATNPLTPTETLTDTAPPMTAEEYQETYANFKSNVLKANNYSEAQFRDMIQAMILRERLREAMSADIDQETEHIESTLFIAQSLEAAQQLQTRLNEGGEDPEALIEELNADEQSSSSGFGMPWLPRGAMASQFGPEVEEIAFSTPVGQASEPFEGPDGESYYIIYITGSERRPLEGQYLDQAIGEKYQSWLNTQLEENVELREWEKAVVTE
ncbi:MAG: SurA N-terminal domain-containing protein [Anaerolineales bacterium]